jgi:hypothetical protein
MFEVKSLARLNVIIISDGNSDREDEAEYGWAAIAKSGVPNGGDSCWVLAAVVILQQ